MRTNPITVKVPGKLMVAGEFAVLEPNHQLLVTAVNRFVYATIEQAEQNELTLIDFELRHIKWEWQKGEIILSCEDNRTDFVKQALETTYHYLAEQKVEVYPTALSIHSELDDSSGIKYGLGSSAAVVTAVVRAVLTAFLPEEPAKLLVFKLASIAHVRTQGNGSGADIAASTYHGVLAYTSFQAEWLLEELAVSPNMTSLVEKDWTYLSLQRVHFPIKLGMLVAWTGKAASTKQLVNKVKQLQSQSYDTFLKASKEAVASILHGMKTNQVELFLDGIRQNRIALATLGEMAEVDIETTKLHTLAMEAEKVAGAGKLSGAGGGDCGIAFVRSDVDVSVLYEAWRKQGITPIDLTIYRGD